MPLVIGVRIEVNNEIMIGDTLVTIDKRIGKRQAQITVHGKCMLEEKIINTDELVNIMGSVKMGLGANTNRGGLIRVLVQAPRSIKIVNTENGTHG